MGQQLSTGPLKTIICSSEESTELARARGFLISRRDKCCWPTSFSQQQHCPCYDRSWMEGFFVIACPCVWSLIATTTGIVRLRPFGFAKQHSRWITWMKILAEDGFNRAHNISSYLCLCGDSPKIVLWKMNKSYCFEGKHNKNVKMSILYCKGAQCKII